MLGNVALVFVYIPFKPKSTHKFIVLAMVFMSTLGLNAALRVSYAANLLRRTEFWRVKQQVNHAAWHQPAVYKIPDVC